MKYKYFFWLLLIIGFLTTIIFIVSQTNIFFKQEGEVSTQKFVITVPEEETIGGLIILTRNKATPQAYDWVSFGEKKYQAFSIDGESEKLLEIIIQPPNYVPSGRYEVNYKITYIDSQREKTGVITFFVR